MRADAPLCTVESEGIFMVGCCSGSGRRGADLRSGASKASNTGFPSLGHAPGRCGLKYHHINRSTGISLVIVGNAKRRG